VIKSSPSKAGIAAALVASLLLPRATRAGESSDVEELRREVRALSAQLQALRTAITEAAEFDRQRTALLTRALKNLPAAPEATASPKAEPAPAPVKSEPASARAVAAAPVRHEARRPAPPPPPEPAVGTIRGRVSIPSGEPVSYVYVENILAPAVKGPRKVIEQSGKKFAPNWAVIQRGTTIEFPNRDNIYHNVFSLTPGNSFDLGLYNSGGEAKAHTFNEAGPVDIYCNIHPQMAASILVVPNKHYAKVKPDGSFEVSGVPAGRRKLVAWAPGSKTTAEWVEVAGGEVAEVTLNLESKAPAHKNKSGQAYGSYE
jgi:plastocyanin